MKKFRNIAILVLVIILAAGLFTACEPEPELPVSVVYTVTYDSQGATGEADPTSQDVTSPATTVETLPTAPTKAGSSFDGWFTEINGGGIEFTVSTTITNDITVYAGWTDFVYALGDTGPSGVGVVFYITDGGTNGLEVAPEDQGTDIAWSNITDSFANGVDALPSTIGTGSANTDAIIAQTSHTSSAAQLCKDYLGGGLNDWFLPSEDELHELYKISMGDPAENLHISAIPALDYRATGLDMSLFYWTSTETSSTNAERRQFEYTGLSGVAKSTGYKVRAIRVF